MELPLQIRVHNVSISQAVRDDIQEKAAKLDRYSNRITACRVTVDNPHRHQHQGARYNVQIDLTLPGDEIVVKHQADEDIYVAVRDAFDAARRLIEDYERKRRGAVKHHETPPRARVVRLFPEKGYGFLETADGGEIYFHRNSVLNDAFGRLAIGAQVRFVEEMGEKGPQASTVEIVHARRRSAARAGDAG